jgi:hypothetical protein
MERKRDFKYLVNALCKCNIRTIHDSLWCFLENELLREQRKIKKRGVIKYKKEFDKLKEALDGLYEYMKRLYDMIHKDDDVDMVKEDDVVDDDDDDDDENVDFDILFQDYQGNGGNQ